MYIFFFINVNHFFLINNIYFLKLIYTIIFVTYQPCETHRVVYVRVHLQRLCLWPLSQVNEHVAQHLNYPSCTLCLLLVTLSHHSGHHQTQYIATSSTVLLPSVCRLLLPTWLANTLTELLAIICLAQMPLLRQLHSLPHNILTSKSIIDQANQSLFALLVVIIAMCFQSQSKFCILDLKDLSATHHVWCTLSHLCLQFCSAPLFCDFCFHWYLHEKVVAPSSVVVVVVVVKILLCLLLLLFLLLYLHWWIYHIKWRVHVVATLSNESNSLCWTTVDLISLVSIFSHPVSKYWHWSTRHLMRRRLVACALVEVV